MISWVKLQLGHTTSGQGGYTNMTHVCSLKHDMPINLDSWFYKVFNTMGGGEWFSIKNVYS